MFKAEIDDSPDVLRWLDRMLIRLCQRLADRRRGRGSYLLVERQLQHLPPIHVPHAKKSVFASFQQQSRQDGFLQTHPKRGRRQQLSYHDSTYLNVVFI